MKKLFSSCIIIAIVQLASAQIPAKLWDSFFNGTLTGEDVSNSVITDNTENVYVTGESFQTSNVGNFTTIKYNAAGVQQWVDHYNTSGTGATNKGIKIVLDKWQKIYAIGTIASNSGDIAVLKFNANGRIWAHNYEPYSSGSDVDFGVDICVDTLGNFYATGQVTSLAGNLWDSYNIKCDSAGTKLFEENYTSGSGDDFPSAVAVTENGNFFVQSNSYDFFGSQGYDIFTINYLNNGNHNWISSYSNPAINGIDYGTFLKADQGSNQYICGTTNSGTNNDMIMMKQNMYGTELWATIYNGTANANDTAITETWLPNGFVVVTGRCKELHHSTTLDAIVTMVIDSGIIVWTNKFYGTDSLGAVPSQMITDAQGNIYICGYEILIDGTKNGCIIKYNDTGNLLWNISYDAGVNLDDKFNSITLDNNSDILVTGQTFTATTNANYVTVKYGNSATSISEPNFINNINIHPNPANTYVTFSFNSLSEESISISIIDMLGREIKNTTPQNIQTGNNTIKINVSEINSGVYFVRINNSKCLVKKLVIEK